MKCQIRHNSVIASVLGVINYLSDLREHAEDQMNKSHYSQTIMSTSTHNETFVPSGALAGFHLHQTTLLWGQNTLICAFVTTNWSSLSKVFN